MIAEDLRPAAASLLDEAGFSPAAQFTRIDGGGNNQVFRAESDGRLAALKVYFHHPQDQRDRLNAEYSYSRLLWDHGVRGVPQPLAADWTARLGLYEFVQGQKLLPAEVDAGALDSALTFFLAGNSADLRRDGQGLPAASEACFSTAAHLGTVRRRLARLDDATDAEARGFVRGQVQPFWQNLEAEVLAACGRLGLKPDDEIALDMRCISPSDFGFHNALREPSGALRFIDFEYAGWDDPAKLVGDFFNQVQVPVSPGFFEGFARRIAGQFPDPERNFARFEMLLPVYAVKWITIMLNDFLPVGEKRRGFAGDPAQVLARKQAQLAKAHQAFDRLAAAPAL